MPSGLPATKRERSTSARGAFREPVEKMVPRKPVSMQGPMPKDDGITDEFGGVTGVFNRKA